MMARLSSFERVLPYLEAHPGLELHRLDQHANNEDYYGVSGPGVNVTFRVFDESARAELEAALRL
jgi:hypothetical protein